jgi:hypothetical protein
MRPYLIAVAIALVFAAGWLQPDIKDFLFAHAWWRAFFVALPLLIVTAVGIFVQLRESARAGELQAEANDLARRIGELNIERNKGLNQIAENTRRERTKAEKNIEILRKYLGARASVTENVTHAPTTPLIAEISDHDIVALFTPAGGGSQAYCVNVHAGDLDVTDMPAGRCAVRLSVVRRHGDAVNLGQITRWEDRSLPAATSKFDKGDMAYNATFSKPGSAETRWILIFASRDGANSFLLQTSTGENPTGNNEEVSKRCMVLDIEFRAAGFNRSSSGTGNSTHRLFIW